MHAVRDERVDEIIVSTFPGESSGWLRRDLVGRLRRETGLPVEHVVVEPAQVEAASLMSAPTPRRTTARPSRNQSSRVDARMLGMFLFIGSEIMLFGSFFTMYFFIRVVNPHASPWPPPPYHLPVYVATHQHGDPRHLELHDALGAAVDQARQPARASRPG